MNIFSSNITLVNNDLNWDVSGFKQRLYLRRFLELLGNSICVFSESVSQLYSNFTLHLPSDTKSNVVVLPSRYEHHDTFNNFPLSAVTQTSIIIFPKIICGELVLYMELPFRNPNESKGQPRIFKRRMPLSIALEILSKRGVQNSAFLPVLMKGDLRALDANIPCIRLHNVNLNQINKLSVFERENINNCINLKLLHLAKKSEFEENKIKTIQIAQIK